MLVSVNMVKSDKFVLKYLYYNTSLLSLRYFVVHPLHVVHLYQGYMIFDVLVSV